MTIAQIIQTDPTLHFYMMQPIDPKLFDWHVKLKCEALRLAIYKWIDKQ